MRWFMRSSGWFLLYLVLAVLYCRWFFTDGIVPGGDTYLYNFPLRWFYSLVLGTGGFPLWNPYEFAGLPMVSITQPGALYPLNLLFFGLVPWPFSFVLNYIAHYAISGFFTFLLLRRMGACRAASFMGGAVYMLGGFMPGNLTHVGIMNAAAWLPLIVLMVYRVIEEPRPALSAGLALAVASQILAGHMQTCLYTYIIAFMVIGSRFLAGLGDWRRSIARPGLFLLSGFALGAFLALPQLMSTWVLSSVSIRPIQSETLGYFFFKEFSVPLLTLPSVLFPGLYFMNAPGEPLGLGEGSIMMFFGILPLVMGLTVFITRACRSREAMLWGVVGVAGLLMATAGETPIGKLLFHLPVYNVFRSHGQSIVLISISLAVLSAMGMDMIFMEREGGASGLSVALVIIIVLSLCCILALRMAGGGEARRLLSLGNPAVLASLLFLLGYLGASIIALRRDGRLGGSLMTVLLVAELFYLGGGAFWFGTGTLRLGDDVCADWGYQRLKGLSGGPVRIAKVSHMKPDMFHVPCGVGSVNSYEVLLPADYARLFDLEFLGMSRYWDERIIENSLLSMLNVGYLAVDRSLGLSPDTIGYFGESTGGELMAKSGSPMVLPMGEDKSRNKMLLDRNLPEGTYLVSFKARALGQRASLLMEAYSPGQAQLRSAALPLTATPGVIGPEGGRYFRIYHHSRPGTALFSFLSVLSEPLEISEVELKRLPGYGPLPISGAEGGGVYRRIFETDRYVFYENTNALGAAFPVRRIEVAGDLWDIKRLFEVERADPSEVAVVYEGDASALPSTGPFAEGTVEVEEYSAGEVSIGTDFPAEGFVVFSEQFYPGWEARIDGKEAVIHRVNGVLQGVVVPGGRHSLVFSYCPRGMIALIVVNSIVFTALFAWILISGFRGGQKGLSLIKQCNSTHDSNSSGKLFSR